MQFIDTAPLYKLIRITGPKHNLLGLWLASGPTEREPEVDAVVLNPNEPARLNAREIVEQVMRGVADACRELHQPYYIDKIQYVTGDTPPVEIYRWLAAQILRRVHAAQS